MLDSRARHSETTYAFLLNASTLATALRSELMLLAVTLLGGAMHSVLAWVYFDFGFLHSSHLFLGKIFLSIPV